MSAPDLSGDPSEAHALPAGGGPPMADELSPRHLLRRLVELAAVMAAVAFADRLDGLGWAVRAAYFLAAGMLWVVPARWLMLWAARKL